jgi:hypothetical protein
MSFECEQATDSHSPPPPQLVSFWATINECVAAFTSERLTNARLAVWLLGEQDEDEDKDKPATFPSVANKGAETAALNWDAWVKTLIPAERATLALLLTDARMWDEVAGDRAARLVCASLVRVCGRSPVETLYLVGSQATHGSTICYRLFDATKRTAPSDELVCAEGAFHLAPAHTMAMMPSLKQSNLVARCRARIAADTVLASYIASTNHTMHPWFQLLAFYFEPLVVHPDQRSAAHVDWYTWLPMAQAMLELVPHIAHSPWHHAIVAFRLAWLLNEELDAYDELRRRNRAHGPRLLTMNRALRGNPRAPNGFETHAQLLARKQLQANTYGWKIPVR